MSNVLSVNTNAEKQQTSVKTTTSTPDEKKDDKKKIKLLRIKKQTQIKLANKETQKPDNKNKSAATPKTIITQTVAIGDSVMLDIEPYLKEAVPNITIDGLVGRQLRDAITTATGYKNSIVKIALSFSNLVQMVPSQKTS